MVVSNNVATNLLCSENQANNADVIDRMVRMSEEDKICLVVSTKRSILLFSMSCINVIAITYVLEDDFLHSKSSNVTLGMEIFLKNAR